MERPVREPGERGRSGKDAQPELARTRCRLAIAANEAVERPVCLGAGHLLLEDRGDQRLEHRARTQHADAGSTFRKGRDPGVARVDELVRAAPEETWDPSDRDFGSGPPTVRPELPRSDR